MTAIIGKTSGLNPSALDALRRLGRRRVDPSDLATFELIRELAEVSAQVGRRVGVLLDRRGRVKNICVGDAHTLPIPKLGRKEDGAFRLRGLRLIHTRFEGGVGCEAGEFIRGDLVGLLRQRLDASVAVTITEGGGVRNVTKATLMPSNSSGEAFRIEPVSDLRKLKGSFKQEVQALEEELDRVRPRAREVERRERAILVGIWNGDRAQAERSMAELAALVAASGAEVVDSMMQRRDKPDPRTLIGRGKLLELNVLCLQKAADVVVFNHELSPAMARNLDEEIPVKVIDRTQLILDIFAQRASSAEGKLEVELARLVHALPRLRGKDERMPQIRGGIGSDRGVGEPKIELDRRKIKRRIALLESKLAKIGAQRRELRKHRERNKIPVVALVGYTNAGKTTILNRITAAEAPAGPQLFMTLESVSRRFVLPSGRRVILVDTVGFIRDLPPGLMRAFKATLEELHGADLLLHIADASDPDVFRQIKVVEEVLEEIGLLERPRLLVFNKVDQVDLALFKPLLKGRTAEFISAFQPGLGEHLGRLIDQNLKVPPVPAETGQGLSP